MKSHNFFWIYIISVTDDRYYTGYTTDIHRRYREHRSGSKKSRFTRSFPPKRMEQCWKVYADRATAMFVERFIKKKGRPVKERFIKQPQTLRQILLKECGRDIPIQVMGQEICCPTPATTDRQSGNADGKTRENKKIPRGKGGKTPG